MLADSLLHWYHMVPCTIPVVDRVVKGKHAPSFVVSPFTLVFNQDYLSNVQTNGSMKLLLSHHSTGGWWIRIATIEKNIVCMVLGWLPFLKYQPPSSSAAYSSIYSIILYVINIDFIMSTWNEWIASYIIIWYGVQ